MLLTNGSGNYNWLWHLQLAVTMEMANEWQMHACDSDTCIDLRTLYRLQDWQVSAAVGSVRVIGKRPCQWQVTVAVESVRGRGK